jgi:hypothetical protein
MRKLVLALAALLALAAIVAGCGGGDSSSSSSSTSSDSASSAESSTEESSSEDESDSEEGSDESGSAPTKAAFIKEADEICAKQDTVMTEEITEFAKENNINTEEEPTEDQQIEVFHEVVLPNIAMQAEEIAALTPPAGDEETVEDITDTLSSEIQAAEEADGIPDESTLEEASKKAKAYGLKTCGS